MCFASKAQRRISFSTEDLPGQEREDRIPSQKDDTDGTTSGGTAGPRFFFFNIPECFESLTKKQKEKKNKQTMVTFPTLKFSYYKLQNKSQRN